MERIRNLYFPDDGITNQLGVWDQIRRVDPDASGELIVEAGQRLNRLCSLVELEVPEYDQIPIDDQNWNDALRIFLQISEYAEEDIKDNPDMAKKKEQLCYPINMLLLSLNEKRRAEYSVVFSEDRTVVGLVGKGYLEMSEREDPVTHEVVKPIQNVNEALRISDMNPDSFPVLLFITLEDDTQLPLYGEEWDSASTHFGGEGPTFSDFGEIHFGIVRGEKFFSKVGVSGVHEVLKEECDDWHRVKPWSPWKEGATRAKLGRLTKDYPCEQQKLRDLIKQYGAPKLWSFKDLVYDWRNSANKKDKEVDNPYFAYYSADLTFLVLAAKIVGDSEFVGEHYSQYAKAIEQFCSTVTIAGVKNSDTDKPKVMIPYALRCTGFESEQQLFDYVDEKLPEFSEQFLKQML